MNLTKAIVLHGLSLCLHLFTMWYSCKYVYVGDLFTYQGFGGRFKYLTFLSQVSWRKHFLLLGDNFEFASRKHACINSILTDKIRL